MIETYDSSYKITQIAKENEIKDIRPADISNVELAGELFVFKLNTINLDDSNEVAILGGDYSVRADRTLEGNCEENTYDILLRLQEIRDKINSDITLLEKLFKLIPV